MYHKILSNKVKCLECNEVIQSVSRHDLVACRCRSIAVDGGLDYLKRVHLVANPRYEDLSDYEEE